MPDSDWKLDARCVQWPPDWWFPHNNNPESCHFGQIAKQICTTCPVQQACQTEADRMPGTVGIWAGVNRTDPRGYHTLSLAELGVVSHNPDAVQQRRYRQKRKDTALVIHRNVSRSRKRNGRNTNAPNSPKGYAQPAD